MAAALACVLTPTLVTPTFVGAAASSAEPGGSLLASGLQGSFGSTVGPGGDLYVVEGVARRVSRVDPKTGTVTTFASGLPAQVIPGVGSATDVEFLGGTAYVLVQFIGPYLGGPDEVNGIYRVDGPHSFTVVADIGAFNVANPPDTDFEAPIGVQTSFQAFQGGFLVTDGHLNRMLRVTLDGDISVLRAFDNVVPVGLETWGNRIYMAEAGPLPHLPADGKIVSFTPRSATATVVAAGGPLLVDVERGRGARLYGLAQGVWPLGGSAGSPAATEYRSVASGQRRRHVHRHRRWAEPARFARDHQEHGVHRQLARGDLEDQAHLLTPCEARIRVTRPPIRPRHRR